MLLTQDQDASQGPVGKPLPRRDGRAKVTGTATYSAEWPMKGHVFAVAAASTIARGKITKIDTSAAEKVPGVIGVMTHENAPKTGKAAAFPAGGSASNIVPLQQPDIYHDGQYIAVAVATTLEAATHAAKLVKASYERQDAETNLFEHADAAEPMGSLWGGGPITESGDPEGALESAATKVDLVYDTVAENHNPIEPHATMAHWHEADADGVELTVFDASQNIHALRQTLANQFGLDAEKVRVVCKFMGGAFGCKGVAWPHVALAVNVARFVDRPVRLVLTREQMYGGVGGRSPTRQRVAMAAGKDGKLTSYIHESTSASARKDTYVEALTSPSKILYAAPNRRLMTKVVRLDIQVPTFMRAPAEAASMFAIESAVDELAEKLGMDPIAFRRINEPTDDPTTGQPFSSRLLMPCYDKAAEAFGWKDRNAEPRSQKHGRWLIGTGCATATYPALAMAASCRITLRADGSAEVASGTHEMGGGTTTAQAQHAARALGLPVERVVFVLGDTRLPYAPVSGGSMTTASIGGAINAAADQLKGQLLALAQRDSESPLAKAAAEDVIFDAGKLVMKNDPGKGKALAEIVSGAYRETVVADGRWMPGENGQETSKHSFGANFAEVAVDEQLGMIRVRRFTCCYACGTILNAQTARSQFIGGVVWGIGQALEEHTVRDHRFGRIMNDNLAEYHVPVNADVPQIDVSWIDDPDYDASPIGAKGIGEIGITGVSAAIANAIYNATGKRLRELPILPKHVLAT